MINTRLQTIAAVGAIGLSMFALVGCSSSNQQAAPSTTEQSSGSDGAQDRQPGVSGTIAAALDGKLQVQGSDSQTAVTYTSATAITRQVEATLADLVAGVCITGGSGAMPGDSGDSSSADADSALSRVSISQPVDGACGFGGGGAGGGGGMPSGETPGGGTPPTDLPEGATPPGDGQAPVGGAVGFVNGLVTKVSGSTLTVETASPDGASSGTAAEQEFTVDDSTVFTKNESATSAALEVGSCVVATGAYSGEDLEATALAVSPAGDQGCSTGFGGRGPGQAGGQSSGRASGGDSGRSGASS